VPFERGEGEQIRNRVVVTITTPDPVHRTRMAAVFFTALCNRSVKDNAYMKVYATFHLARRDIAASNDTIVLHREGGCHG
jgi:hypothetical protein